MTKADIKEMDSHSYKHAHEDKYQPLRLCLPASITFLLKLGEATRAHLIEFCQSRQRFVPASAPTPGLGHKIRQQT